MFRAVRARLRNSEMTDAMGRDEGQGKRSRLGACSESPLKVWASGTVFDVGYTSHSDSSAFNSGTDPLTVLRASCAL